MHKTITFYGADWCGDCKRSKAYLDTHKTSYTYINIDVVEGAAEEVRKINNGLASIPTILFPNGEILVEPTDAVLAKAVAADKETLSQAS
jgi:mycoredoxin